MHICFLGSFSAGGTERACFMIANELSPENMIYILNTGKTSKTFFLKESIQFSNLRGDSILKKNREVYYFLKENKIDVLVTLEAMTGIFSLIPAKLAGCKHIIWEHANYFQNQGSKWIQKIRQLELYLTNGYVVLTKRDLNNFKRNFNCRVKLSQIYNIAESQKDYSYPINSKCIISVGHIRKIKNFIIIPEIAKIVFSEHPDWKWIIYGSDSGEEYERIFQKVNEYGLEKNVIFFGHCNDMEQEYKKASMYVMTSLQEGLPMVLLEAKSYGIPLLSFDIETGPDEIIRDGVNGFLVQPYDVDVMAEKICLLIEDNNLRQGFSNNSKLDLENFLSEKIVEQWRNLLDTVVKE